MTEFLEAWRRQKSAAFSLPINSTARRTIEFSLFGRPVEVYANANLSIYSGQRCNARCAFCVEELRPLSRGGDRALDRQVERDDEVYFDALAQSLAALRPLDPSVSITGGEPSKDPRLPRTLRTAAVAAGRKRTLTTNGSGLLDRRSGKRVIDWIGEAGLQHLNLSRAHPDHQENARLMRLSEGLSLAGLTEVVALARAAGIRVRLSCVLLEEAIHDRAGLLAYLDFARSIGVDNVIFRQLMQVDRGTVRISPVVRYSDRQRTALEPLLDQLSADPRFCWVRQIVGYYYYVEVWRYDGLDVVFEEADLAQLEREKRAHPGLIHELVFHPNGCLASTWQPWDGVLGPPPLGGLAQVDDHAADEEQGVF